MNGKGSKRRPSQISQSELDRRWQQAFGNCPNTEQTVQLTDANHRPENRAADLFSGAQHGNALCPQKRQG